MADKHPYISGPGGISAAINQFKKAFPSKVTADTLTKLGIAPNNETYVINILRFIGAIEPDGTRTSKAAEAFSKHDPTEFAEAFSDLVKTGYKDLFALHGDAAWTLNTNKLISFFRGSDQTSDVVGRRQAQTFQVLASFSGHGEVPAVKPAVTKQPMEKKQAKAAKPPAQKSQLNVDPAGTPQATNVSRDVGLTVRIEVNLPAVADQETYDKIFRSIRENLLNDK